MSTTEGFEFFDPMSSDNPDYSYKDLTSENFSGAPLDNENFQGANLQGADFSYASLVSANLSYLDFGTDESGKDILGSVDFSYAEMMSADLSGSKFSGETSFEGADLTDAKFVGAVVRSSMDSVDASSADFSSADLTGVDFSFANLDGAGFENADAEGAIFNYASLQVAQFYDADLDGANFSGADLESADFSNASLIGADLSNLSSDSTDYMSIDFSFAQMMSADLSGSKFTFGTNFSSADLSDAKLVSSGFYTSMSNLVADGADFSGSWFEMSSFANSSLVSANFDNTEFYMDSGSFKGATLTDASFVSADFNDYANFEGASAKRADFSFADLGAGESGQAKFASADLDGANFSGADLHNANFSYASLIGADLSGADLTGVDLTGADLSGVDLTGVKSGGITGTPSTLDGGVILSNGYLIGPGVNLEGADLSGVDLTGVKSGGITGTPTALDEGVILFNGYLIGPNVNLEGADLTGVDLTGADLTGVVSGGVLRGSETIGLEAVGPVESIFYAPERLSSPEILAFSGGGHLLAWSDGNVNLKGQLFNDDGQRVLDFNIVQNSSGEYVFGLKLMELDAGGFAAFWSEYVSSNYIIKGRIFDSLGDPSGNDFIVSNSVIGSSFLKDISQTSDGGFIVSWRSQISNDYSSGVDLYDAYAQKFNADGQEVGSQFLLANAPGNQYDASTAPHESDGFVAVWGGESSSQKSIEFQRFDDSGDPISAESLIRAIPYSDNSYSHIGNLSIEALEGENFVVIWSEYRSGNGYKIFGQILTNDGSAVEVPFLVKAFDNNEVSGETFSVEASSVDDGGFSVIWTADGNIDGTYKTFTSGQYFDKSAQPVGESFIFPEADGYSYSVSAQSLSDGNLLVSWTDSDSDYSISPAAHDSTVYSQKFAPSVQWNEGVILSNGYLVGPNVNLSDADLTDADLSGADLTGADLTGADLSGADLSSANLTGADLRGVDLSPVLSFEQANLTEALIDPGQEQHLSNDQQLQVQLSNNAPTITTETPSYIITDKPVSPNEVMFELSPVADQVPALLNGDEGLGSYLFELNFDPTVVSIDPSAIIFNEGQTGWANMIDAENGVISVGAIPPLQGQVALYDPETEGPMLSVPVTLLDKTKAVEFTIDESDFNDVGVGSVQEEFNFISREISGTVLTRGGEEMSGVELTADFFIADEVDSEKTISSHSDGTFTTDLAFGVDMDIAAHMPFVNSGDTKSVTPHDALETLLLSVGLETTAGSFTKFDMMAADFDQNGEVSAEDALAILKYSVGVREDIPEAKWVFVEGSELEGNHQMDVNAPVELADGYTFSDGYEDPFMTADTTIDLTGILLGDVTDTYSSLDIM